MDVDYSHEDYGTSKVQNEETPTKESSLPLWLIQLIFLP
jgi:hypothetical protein